jgi:hypothetical protein
MILSATGILLAFQVFSGAYSVTPRDDPGSVQNEPRCREWKPWHRLFVQEGYVKYRLEEGYFECEIPDKWIDIRNRDDDRRDKVYGMNLVLKHSQPGPKPFITVDYYAPDNHYFSSAERYLSRQFETPFFNIKGEKISEIREVLVNGNKARQFVRDTFDFWPPHSMDTRQIGVREEYTVLEAREGFFVLTYGAPDNQFTTYRPLYQHILDTFKPFPTGHLAGRNGRPQFRRTVNRDQDHLIVADKYMKM